MLTVQSNAVTMSSLELVAFINSQRGESEADEQLDLSQFENAIIYCDPPYDKTAKYQVSFDTKAFFDWFKSHPQKIYLSEYDAPFKLIYEKEKRVTMSATNNKLKKIERLFKNK
jgi:hypothetical protein